MLIFAVILICFGAQRFDGFSRGHKSRDKIDFVFQAFTNRSQTHEVWSSDFETERNPPKRSLALWIAQGFGVGRIRVAPGTFGSVLGFGWMLLLLWPRHSLTFILGLIAGIALSVRLCDLAENQLQQKDPSSVVLDEIVAMPLCFLGWLGFYFEKHQALPAPVYFFRSETWLLTAGTFVLFRLFDIVKPWPLRQSQALPGGWGITVDDVLAAVYTAIVTGFLAAEFL